VNKRISLFVAFFVFALPLFAQSVESTSSMLPASSSLVPLSSSVVLSVSSSSVSPILAARKDSVDVIAITTLSPKEFDRKKGEIDTLLASGGLNEVDKQGLLALREKTTEMISTNEECRNFDINSAPNEHCRAFYRGGLESYEDDFGRVTSSVYLNRLEQVAAMPDRKEQIRTCISAMQAFVNPSYLRQNLVIPKVVQSVLEPVTDVDADYFYGFQVGINEGLIAKLAPRAERWNEVCKDVVKHPVNTAFAPYFLNSLPAQLEKSGFLVKADSTKVLIINKGKYHYGYTLNGKVLIEGMVSPLFVEGGKILLKIAMEQTGAHIDIMLRADSMRVFQGKTRIPLKDSSGVIISWRLDTLDVNGGVGNLEAPLVPPSAIPQKGLHKPLSVKRKIALALWGTSLVGAGGGAFMNQEVKSSVDDYRSAEAQHNAVALQDAYDKWESSKTYRNAGYSLSIGTAVLGLILWFWPEGGKK